MVGKYIYFKTEKNKPNSRLLALFEKVEKQQK